MRKGFTLAEVLITLGIIGIVALMTLPALIENHQRKTLYSQFKKSYGVFQTALNTVNAENGIVYECYAASFFQIGGRLVLSSVKIFGLMC